MFNGKGKIFTIFMILIAAIVSICLYFVLIGNMDDVLVVNRTVRGGTMITQDMISYKKADKSSLPKNYITVENEEKIIGKYLDLGLTEGSVLTVENISTKGKASLIKEGYVLHPITDLNAYPNNLLSGDCLNILVSSSNSGDRYVKTIENVMVANVNMEEGEIKGVEVYVTPEQAQLIAFGQSNGEISISLLPLGYESKNLEAIYGTDFLDAPTSAQLNQDLNPSEGQ